MLDITTSDHASHWKKMETPVKLYSHSMVSFKGSMIITGGYDSKKDVWKGILDAETDEITWTRCAPMKYNRDFHFSLDLGNRIVIIGGRDRANDNVEYFDGETWTEGPKLPFEINTYNSQCILDRMNRIIIITNDNGLILIDIEKETWKHYEKYGLRDLRPGELRGQFVALLQ